MAFLTDADKAALAAAATAIEARSSAEILIVIRAQSDPYLHADLLAGIAAGVLLLWFQLFSPWEFSLPWILVGPILFGGATGLLVSRAPGTRRLLTGARWRERIVRNAARAEFLEQGIDTTRGRTGILVYVSILERMAEVVADRGVLRAVPAGEWNAKSTALKQAVAGGERADALAAHVSGLTDLLARALPRAADDEDELSHEVVA
jgi:putative membrane protein